MNDAARRRRRLGSPVERVVGAVDRGDPRGRRRVLADDDRGHDQLAGAPGRNGSAPSAIGPRRAAPTVVVVLDRGEDLDGLVDRHPRRHATTGEPDALAHEQVAVAAGDVVQVDVATRAVG